MNRAELVNLAGDIWVLVFAASFLASIAAGAIQIFRGKDLWETPAMPLLAIQHFAWVLPLIAPILLIWLICLAFQRVWRRLVS